MSKWACKIHLCLRAFFNASWYLLPPAALLHLFMPVSAWNSLTQPSDWPNFNPRHGFGENPARKSEWGNEGIKGIPEKFKNLIQSTVSWHLAVCALSHVWPFSSLWTVATKLVCLWNFPGGMTGVGCHFLLQGSSQPGDRPHLLRVLH